MKKWKYEKEITNAVDILVQAYLSTMHSKVITICYTNVDKLYSVDLNASEVHELARVNGTKLMTQLTGKKRIEKYSEKATFFGTVEELKELKKHFPNVNNGYLMEYLYRIKATKETIEDIKHNNNSKGYDIASDTIDDKQIKCIDNGATFTRFEYLLKVCKRKSYDKTNEVENAINFLQSIYESEAK